MESSIINYSQIAAEDGSLRIDAEHYKSEYFRIKKLLLKNRSQELLRFIDRPVMTGHTPSMKNEKFYGGNVNFIKTDNLREHYIEGEFTHKLSEEGNKKIKRSSLKENDVLVTIIGATFQIVGRACLIKKKDLPANINQNIALIRVTRKLSPEYLTIYLNSYYGRNYLWYLSRQTEQVNLNCREVEKLLIPVFSSNLTGLSTELHKKAYSLYEKADELLQHAEQILLSELNLLNWKPKHRLSFIKNFSGTKSADRVDAEYFQPMYEEIVKRVTQYKKGNKPLGEIVKIKDKNFLPKNDVTYRYIELANISANGNINGFIEAKGNELPSRARRKVNTGDVIVSSIEGSLSSIALITNDLDGALCSTGFFVVKSDDINSETLLVSLKSLVGQLQLKKGCSGSILTAIGKDEFERIILPDIPADVQEEIKQNITEMYNAKASSKRLLDIAKRSVEMAIEKNEQTAMEWINKNVKD
jgi:restriction endonuclease S subunit